jgi:hypothetical protein
MGFTFSNTCATRPSGSITNGGAGDAHVLASHHVLLDPDAVGLRHGVIGVGDECERKLVLRLELPCFAGESGLHS